jgi:hypothetical protein
MALMDDNPGIPIPSHVTAPCDAKGILDAEKALRVKKP